MDIKLSESAHDNRPFCQLYKAVINIVEDKRLHDLAKDLEAKAEVFDKLRTAMCIALPEGKNGINDVQIDKYWKKLFADPIPVVTPIGILQVQPQRTNNLLERFFRDEKRRSRKKTGMASLNRVLKKALADTPLVRNLKNGEYVKIILNGCSTLAERFSQIDTHLVQQEMANAANSSEKILPAIRKMIRDVELTRKISALFRPLDAR
jgi:hypothetical protein